MARLTLPRLTREGVRLQKARTVLTEFNVYIREVATGNTRARDTELNKRLLSAAQSVTKAMDDLQVAIRDVEKVRITLENRRNAK